MTEQTRTENMRTDHELHLRGKSRDYAVVFVFAVAAIENLLDSHHCHCGERKHKRYALFCPRCFKALPRDMRHPFKWIYQHYGYAGCTNIPPVYSHLVGNYDRAVDYLANKRRGLTAISRERRAELQEACA